MPARKALAQIGPRSAPVPSALALTQIGCSLQVMSSTMPSSTMTSSTSASANVCPPQFCLLQLTVSDNKEECRAQEKVVLPLPPPPSLLGSP